MEMYLCNIRKSSCCNASQLLVQSREGGFVSKNCTECGKSRRVRLDELPEVQCDSCGVQMHKTTRLKNYAYVCPQCEDFFSLWSRIPYWSECFPVCGLATPRASLHTGASETLGRESLDSGNQSCWSAHSSRWTESVRALVRLPT